MAFCGNCGTKVEDGKKFCPECGAPMEAAPQQQPQQQPQQAPQQQVPPVQQFAQQPNAQQPAPGQAGGKTKGGMDYTAQFDPADIEANKVMAFLGYILFLIPMLAAKESRFAQFHANQGLILLLAGIIVGTAGSIIPVLGWFLILPIGCVAVAILGIIGILNALGGKAKDLPLIGKYRLLK